MRDLARQALDQIADLTGEVNAAKDYIKSLESAAEKDQQLIDKQKILIDVDERTIQSLDRQVKALQTEADAAEKGRTEALKEADRQKNRASRWKKIAEFGTALGIAAGAMIVLAIKK